MKSLLRNQLVSIDERAWAQIEDRTWDAEAQEILAHWRINRLPFVVCRQRTETATNRVCVGLPAPQQWSKRRLALTLSFDHITACAAFPTLMQVAQANHWGPAALGLSEALYNFGAQAHVYGSHGWQWLTGLRYLHAESDLDLSLGVTSFEMALKVTQLLASSQLHARIDGEIVFPQGPAVAWRELQQLLQGQASQVLVKDRHSIRLATLTDVRRLGDGAQLAEPEAAPALT